LDDLSQTPSASPVAFRAAEISRLCQHAGSDDSHILPMERAGEGLYEGFRQDAIDYFSDYSIKWWLSEQEATERKKTRFTEHPTGHLTSSQLACVNHLEPARTDEALALQIARAIDPTLRRVLPIPDEGGFVAFEWLPTKDLLNESSRRTRGANVTSLDALMLGERSNGDAVILAIEWKYLETYGHRKVAQVSPAGTDRLARYKTLLEDPGCPIKPGDPLRLFYEPYYQLMRQTLLAWQLTRFPPDDWPEVGDWLHVHVIPAGHLRLRNHVPRDADWYQGHMTLESAWRSFLKKPERYRLLTPTSLVPADVPDDWSEWRVWLNGRYAT
jgi:Restriction Endonuclease associating with ARP